MSKSEVVVLAGGKGVRMNSSRPKSMQEIGGIPMLRHILSCVQNSGFDVIHVIYGTHHPEIKKLFPEFTINWVPQSAPLGTGHALLQAVPYLGDDSTVCVLYGDNPFIQSGTVRKLMECAGGVKLALLTFFLDNPGGYGRIVRDENNQLVNIVEEKDATEEQRKIREVNAGPMAAPSRLLKGWVKQLDSNNAQKEYYLTDIVGMAVADGINIATCHPLDNTEAAGANDRIEQSELERKYQLKSAKELMEQGVEIVDPGRFDIRGSCIAGKDCRIDVNVVLEGKVVLGDNVYIGPNNVIRDTELKSNVSVLPNCVIDGAVVESGSTIGPFSRIRSGSHVGENSKVGSFVEVNRSSLGKKTKVSHLAYIGDATLGDEVNVGAGSITCNYDGVNKNKTNIGDRVFIGSNSSLVAPIEVGDDAVIGAGSTVSEDIESNELVIERAKIAKKSAARFKESRKTKS